MQVSVTDGEFQPVDERVDMLYTQQMSRYHSETDRIFAGLMLFQLLGGVVMALVVSPSTWIGDTASVHLHVWSAIGLGTLLSAFPIFLALLHPGETLTRHVIAVSQMFWSALLIHLSGGRIETHFHVFGSLAFLAFYRDWKVLVTATIVVAGDHFVRGVFWPMSVFGVLVESPYRWIEHAAWVVFEDFILVLACLRGTTEMRESCRRQSMLEQTNAHIEHEVEHRTAELRAANQKLAAEVEERLNAEARETQLGRILEQSVNEIYIFDRQSLRFLEVNRGALNNLGYTLEEITRLSPLYLFRDFTVDTFVKMLKPLVSGKAESMSFQADHCRKDGSTYPVEVHLQLSEWQSRPAYIVIALDITERRAVEAERDSAQRQLVKASRIAGMAEIATGVLHNVGNILNSVNVSATLIQEKVSMSRTANVGKVAELLHQNEGQLGTFFESDSKGRMLPGYLKNLAQTLCDDETAVLEEIRTLTTNIAHIKEIVQMQQSYAKVSGATESLCVSELLDEALKVESDGLERHEIAVVRDYGELPLILTERHRLMQIIVNLISNAKNAMVEADLPEKQLTISTDVSDGHVCIACSDTGMGIAAENLAKIFTHGFTTRKAGHGFGLHSSALAAKELGGTLTVDSSGVGKGATFTVRIPVGSSEILDSEAEDEAELSEATELAASVK
jgi:PAS domain S-box-containing protein